MILPQNQSQGQQLDAQKKAELRKIMEDEMSTVIQKVIDATPPGSMGGMTYGKSRIAAEVNRVFQPIRSEWFSDVVAQGQWEPVSSYRFIFRNKRLEDAFNRRQLDVLDRAFNDAHDKDSNVVINWAGMEPRADLHQAQRGGDGQIVQNNTVYYVQDKRSINKYAAAVAKSVGKMVSGWYEVLNKLGKSSKSPFPGKGKGDVKFTEGNGQISLTANNELGNFNAMLPRLTQPQQLINTAAANCQRRASELLRAGKDPSKGKMGAPSAPMTTPKQQIVAAAVQSQASTMRNAGTPKQQRAMNNGLLAVSKFLMNGYAQQATNAAVYSVVAQVGPIVADKNSSFTEIGKKLVEYEKSMQDLQKIKGSELINAALGGGYSGRGGIEDQLQTLQLLEGWKDD